MSNTTKEKNRNKFTNLDKNTDYWEIFQSESDETRNLLLNFLTNKCTIHKEENFENPENFDLTESNFKENFHFEHCKNYLFDSEKRRNPFRNGKLLYSKYPCKSFFNKSNCQLGENCEFSHNQLEILFHPFNFRKEICKQNECENKKSYCFMAHKFHEKRNFPYLKKNSFNSKELKNPKDKNLKDFEENFRNKNECLIMKNNENKENSMGDYKKKENDTMLNRLNLDIKNLLDEVDFDLNEEEDSNTNLTESKRIKIKKINFFIFF